MIHVLTSADTHTLNTLCTMAAKCQALHGETIRVEKSDGQIGIWLGDDIIGSGRSLLRALTDADSTLTEWDSCSDEMTADELARG